MPLLLIGRSTELNSIRLLSPHPLQKGAHFLRLSPETLFKKPTFNLFRGHPQKATRLLV